jgi:hypothetical protein
MKYTAQELKKLTAMPTRAQGETALYASLEGRQWHLGDRAYTLAGYDRRKDLVHFTATWPRLGGGVFHSRIGLALRLAVDGAGDLTGASTLH